MRPDHSRQTQVTPTLLHPFAIIMHCCPLLRARGSGVHKVNRRGGGVERFTHKGAAAIDGKPPAAAGAPEGPLNSNIRDVFLRGEGSLWELVKEVGAERNSRFQEKNNRHFRSFIKRNNCMNA